MHICRSALVAMDPSTLAATRRTGQSSRVPDDQRVLRLSYDKSADAAYIYLEPADVIPSVVRTEHVGTSIHLDFDDQGRLVGVEVLSAALLHPALLTEGGFAP